jgi:4-amino-4-deoxy-L-arabinose transferase-like glycosyltransferase
MGLAWALPAATAGGQGYANAILWGQTVDRVADAFDHQRPLWWYLVGLPLVLMPLILWPGFVRGLTAARHHLRDPGVRLCLTWFLSVFVILSLISAKQVHYLLPAVPPVILLAIHGLDPTARSDRFLSLALLLVLVGGALVTLPLVARLITVPPNLWWATHLPAAPGWLLMMAGLVVALRRRTWSAPGRILGMALGTGLLAAAVQVSLLSAARPAFDLRDASLYLQSLEKRGVTLAHFSEYHGQFHFLGRLERPFTVLGGRANVASWLEEHPAAAAIHYVKPWSADLRQRHAYAQPYRGGALVVSLGGQVEP